MEVKDVRSTKLVVENKPARTTNQSANSKPATNETADVVISDQTRASGKTQVRQQLNDVINVANVAKDVSGQIDRIVQSISGIIKQARQEGLPDQRRAALEKEANQLVEEIKKAAETPASNGLRPLAGDKIRLEVEEKIGKTLDVILPDDAKNAFGITEINFSTKDSIISTIASVEQAEQNILRLKSAVEEASKNVSETAAAVDVALQNSEASETSIRDLDQALKLAAQTREIISEDPKKALKSLGAFSTKSFQLLE